MKAKPIHQRIKETQERLEQLRAMNAPEAIIIAEEEIIKLLKIEQIRLN